MNNNRRNFFKTIGTAAAGVAAINPLINPNQANAALAPGYRAAFLHSLILDGSLAGIVREFDGGDAVGVVVHGIADEAGIVRKHIGDVTFGEISIACGAEMTAPFFGWISQLLNRTPIARSGAILSADAAGRTQNQLSFMDALITEVTFPELESDSKAPASFALKLAPEFTRIDPPSLPTISGSQTTKAKQWLTSNYRVSIGTIPADTTARVSKVEALTIKQKLIAADPGEIRDPFIDVEPLDIGNIVLSVPEKFAQPFIDWHHSFVIQGFNAAENETYMKIEYLGVRGEVLFSLMLFGVGIFRVTRLGETDKRINQRIVQASLYAETAAFYVGEPPTS